jgi:hypothetical protein
MDILYLYHHKILLWKGRSGAVDNFWISDASRRRMYQYWQHDTEWILIREDNLETSDCFLAAGDEAICTNHQYVRK